MKFVFFLLLIPLNATPSECDKFHTLKYQTYVKAQIIWTRNASALVASRKTSLKEEIGRYQNYQINEITIKKFEVERYLEKNPGRVDVYLKMSNWLILLQKEIDDLERSHPAYARLLYKKKLLRNTFDELKLLKKIESDRELKNELIKLNLKHSHQINLIESMRCDGNTFSRNRKFTGIDTLLSTPIKRE